MRMKGAVKNVDKKCDSLALANYTSIGDVFYLKSVISVSDHLNVLVTNFLAHSKCLFINLYHDILVTICISYSHIISYHMYIIQSYNIIPYVYHTHDIIPFPVSIYHIISKEQAIKNYNSPTGF